MHVNPPQSPDAAPIQKNTGVPDERVKLTTFSRFKAFFNYCYGVLVQTIFRKQTSEWKDWTESNRKDFWLGERAIKVIKPRDTTPQQDKISAVGKNLSPAPLSLVTEKQANVPSSTTIHAKPESQVTNQLQDEQVSPGFSKSELKPELTKVKVEPDLSKTAIAPVKPDTSSPVVSSYIPSEATNASSPVSNPSTASPPVMTPLPAIPSTEEPSVPVLSNPASKLKRNKTLKLVRQATMKPEKLQEQVKTNPQLQDIFGPPEKYQIPSPKQDSGKGVLLGALEGSPRAWIEKGKQMQEKINELQKLQGNISLFDSKFTKLRSELDAILPKEASSHPTKEMPEAVDGAIPTPPAIDDIPDAPPQEVPSPPSDSDLSIEDNVAFTPEMITKLNEFQIIFEESASAKARQTELEKEIMNILFPSSEDRVKNVDKSQMSLYMRRYVSLAEERSKQETPAKTTAPSQVKIPASTPRSEFETNHKEIEEISKKKIPNKQKVQNDLLARIATKNNEINQKRALLVRSPEKLTDVQNAQGELRDLENRLKETEKEINNLKDTMQRKMKMFADRLFDRPFTGDVQEFIQAGNKALKDPSWKAESVKKTVGIAPKPSKPSPATSPSVSKNESSPLRNKSGDWET